MAQTIIPRYRGKKEGKPGAAQPKKERLDYRGDDLDMIADDLGGSVLYVNSMWHETLVLSLATW